MRITKTQKNLLEIIRNSIQSGEEISVRRLQEEMEFSSPRAITYQLDKLEEFNLVRRDSNGRIIWVSDADDSGPAVAYLPLLGDVPCGTPFVVEENYEKMVPVPLRLLGRPNSKDLYIVRASGNSMYPKIESGDYVVFKAETSPEFNSIVVARTSDGVTIKKLLKTNQQVILKPINEEFQPLIFDSESGELEIVGTAVALFKPEANF